MNTIRNLGLVTASIILINAPAFGAGEEPYGYVRDSFGKVVRSSSGECVRARANVQEIAAECAPAKSAAATPPVVAKAAEPPAAVAPTPAPIAAAPAPTPAPEPQAATPAPEPAPTPIAAAPAPEPVAIAPVPVAAVEPAKPEPETVTIKGDALFGFNRADIKPDARQQLSEIASKLKGQQNIDEIVISGHTDASGPEIYNKDLSQKRAESVKSFLIGEGIVSKRIVVQGLGEEKPVASNDTGEGRAQNRRVEITVQATSTPQ